MSGLNIYLWQGPISVFSMIVIGKKYGQLGNRLFLYAHFIANAKDHRYVVFNPAFDEYASFFKGTAKSILIRYNPTKSTPIADSNETLNAIRQSIRPVVWKVFLKILEVIAHLGKEESPFHRTLWLDPGTSFDLTDEKCKELLGGKSIVILGGWRFENHEELRHNREEICSYFTPVKSLMNNINNTVNRARFGHDLLVGVHIRRGDYAEWQNGKYYFEIETYKKLMNEIIRLMPNKRVSFLICSNEMIDSANWEGLDVSNGSGHLVEDMYSLAECDYLIGPPSTFSIWASFYGQKPLYTIENPEQVFQITDFRIHDDLVPPQL